MTFASLGLHADLLSAVAAFEAPTRVQAEAVPALLAGKDVWASAPTGSGKTAAYALPILQGLARDVPAHPRPIRALVLAPTRELAAQIGEAFESFGRHLHAPPQIRVAFGGVSINPQMMSLRGGADVVVATPGRLLDLVEHNALRLSAVRTLVVDEADRMLSLGFADELARVLALLPATRQSVLVSATFPPAVRSLAGAWLRDPTRVVVDGPLDAGASTLVHRAIEVDEGKRTRLLLHLLEVHGWPQLLVFVASRHAADHIAAKLRKAGVAAGAIHGELAQGIRTRALADLATMRIRVLVATDVAARGLDIVALPAVVSYDLPRSPTDYVHRVGRTARAGASGVAISFVTAEGRAHFRLIEKRNQLSVEREQIDGFVPIDEPPPGDPHGGVKGVRKSKKDKLREAAALAAAAAATRARTSRW
jgi:ATP-dependent RNA helicase RhlE